MFGFAFGAACLAGLFYVARGHRRWHHHGRHGRFFLHRVLHRLDTTPGQEKVIREAIDDLREEARDLRQELKGTRTQIASALRAPELDRALLDEVFKKHDALLAELRGAATSATARIHETLDERQRKTLADLVEDGWHYAAC